MMLILYALGAGVGSAVIYFPITYLAMKSQWSFRGGLRQAWKPFSYCILLLWIFELASMLLDAKFDVKNGPYATVEFVAEIALQIMVCAAVLHLTYRDTNVPPPPPT